MLRLGKWSLIVLSAVAGEALLRSGAEAGWLSTRSGIVGGRWINAGGGTGWINPGGGRWSNRSGGGWLPPPSSGTTRRRQAEPPRAVGGQARAPLSHASSLGRAAS